MIESEGIDGNLWALHKKSLKFPIREFEVEIHENDTCFTELKSKLDIRTKVIKFYHKIFETFSALIQMKKISSMYLNYTRG